MYDEAPDGSEAPREPLKAKIVPAKTIWFFLSCEYTLSTSQDLRLKIERFQVTLENSTAFFTNGTFLDGNSASELLVSCVTITASS